MVDTAEHIDNKQPASAGFSSTKIQNILQTYRLSESMVCPNMDSIAFSAAVALFILQQGMKQVHYDVFSQVKESRLA